VTDLVGGADGAPQPEEAALLHDLRAEAIAVARRGLDRFRRVAPLTTSRAVLRPDVGAPGPVTTEDVVVGERVPEEVRALEPAPQGLLLVVVAHERGDARDVGIDRVTDGHALGGERL